MRVPSLRVRDATESDVEALTQLGAQVQNVHAAGRPDLFRVADVDALRDFFRDRLSRGWLVLVADREGMDPAGYVLAEILERPGSPFSLPETAVYIHHIAVDGSSRRTGVGDLLIAEVIERASRAGAASIRLDSWSFNEGAHRFFEAQGFTVVRNSFELAQGNPREPS